MLHPRLNCFIPQIENNNFTVSLNNPITKTIIILQKYFFVNNREGEL